MSAPVPRAYDAAAVVIPARNERAKLSVCLRAVLTAALCAPVPVKIVVVLDDNDDSAALAGQYGPDVHFISVQAHNVGAARAVGFGYARSLFGPDAECWYATTDAGSRVDPGWLVHQMGFGAGEGVDLVDRFEAVGYSIHRDTELSVITSARTRARAPQGFARRLSQLGRSAAGDCA